MAITEKQVKEALRMVMDPELHVNIVDLGLIYKLQVTRNKKPTRQAQGKQETKVKILMTLTTPGCPLAGMFDAMVRNALKKIPGLDANRDVEIELTFDPPWVTDMMTEEVRAELGLD